MALYARIREWDEAMREMHTFLIFFAVELEVEPAWVDFLLQPCPFSWIFRFFRLFCQNVICGEFGGFFLALVLLGKKII